MPVAVAVVEDVETFLVDQLEALADELWSRIYDTEPKRPWSSATCPWCRRLTDMGMTEFDCPICRQVERSAGVVEGRSGGHHPSGYR